MIKTLSPYYLNIPLIAPLSLEVCSSFTLQIFAWNGNKSDEPLEPIYEITKDNPALFDGSVEINISLLINDFIDFMPNFSNTTELVNGNNQYWVKTQIFYTTSNESDYIANFPEIVLFLQGYGYGNEGKNPQLPGNKILIPIQDYKVNRNGFFNIPILINESTDEYYLFITNVVNTTDSNYEYSFTSNFTFTTLQVQYRLIGTSTWSSSTNFAGVTSPQNIIVPLGSSFETRISALNGLGFIIYSNIFTI